MRAAALAMLAALVLAGCSDSSPELDASDFDDLGVAPTATTGILVGVVVDEAIRPLAEAQVTATGPDGKQRTGNTDDAGRFAFEDLAPGVYILSATRLNYQSAQTSTNVEAGVANPPVVRIQLARLFDQQAFVEQFQFDGFLSCSISFPIGTTCVNDYTRLVPQCNGGCLKDYELSKTAGNKREYVYTINAGWQSIIFETTWDRTSDYSSEELNLLVSYYSRASTSHYHGAREGTDPLHLRIDLGDDSVPGAREDPNPIPPEGTNELFIFFNSGGIPPGGGLVINQAFRHFQHTFYYGIPPPDWSFIAGDNLPF